MTVRYRQKINKQFKLRSVQLSLCSSHLYTNSLLKGIGKRNNKIDMLTFDNADIYCHSSKIGLSTRKPEFLQMIQESVREWGESPAVRKMSFNELVYCIVDNASNAILQNNWNPNEMDGAAWFIGNFTDIVTQARADCKDKYDELFKEAFNLYFKDKAPCDAVSGFF